MGIFALASYDCGKSIDNRKWGKSVWDFLFALGRYAVYGKELPSILDLDVKPCERIA